MTITIATTAAQDAILTRIVNKFNADQLAVNPAFVSLTMAQYFQNRINDLLNNFQTYISNIEQTSIENAYSTASPATQTIVKTALGITFPI